jgi:hypothetical protein
VSRVDNLDFVAFALADPHEHIADFFDALFFDAAESQHSQQPILAIG